MRPRLLIVPLVVALLAPAALAVDIVEHVGVAQPGLAYGRTFADGSTELCEYATGSLAISRGDDATWLYRVDDAGLIQAASSPSCPATFSAEARLPVDLWAQASGSEASFAVSDGCKSVLVSLSFGLLTIVSTPRGDRDVQTVQVALEQHSSCPGAAVTALAHSRLYVHNVL